MLAYRYTLYTIITSSIINLLLLQLSTLDYWSYIIILHCIDGDAIPTIYCECFHFTLLQLNHNAYAILHIQ